MHWKPARCLYTIPGLILSGLLGASLGEVQAAPRAQPDIIYIMSDDMGFSDIGCYGSEIETPHLDSLAAGGVRFTQFYNTARCCPTRASLLSGLYPHQAGVGHMMNDRGTDGYRGELNRHCVTIAEVLQSAGYRNYLSGKWHVTSLIKPDTEEGKHNWPRQRGFDRFYGTISGAGSFFDPYTLARDNTPISAFSDPEYQPETFYYTDAISDQAARYIREHDQQHRERPLFMYVAYTAAHWPMHAREKDIAKYRGRYDAGYQAIRDERYHKMLRLGLIDKQATVNWPIPDEWKETEHLAWDIRNMEVYGAMIDSMDQGIGRIIKALKDTGRFDNTLICFFQDNGGCAENYGRGGVGRPRASQPEREPLSDAYIQPDMTPRQNRDGYTMRTGKGSMAGPDDTAIGYGRGWATVSNTPFREYKHWVHEGGISTPLIAHWPARISRRGDLESTPGHLVDLMATAVDVAGATYPETFHGGQVIYPMEGRSLVPAFEGQPVDRDALYWEHEGNRAIRVGDWKAVAKGARGPWELYDISRDRSEQQNLATEQPDRLASLTGQWQAWAERAHVLPLNPSKSKTSDARTFNRKQKRFTLAPGDDLDRWKAPFVEGRGLTVTARVTPVSAAAHGVVVAQGGSTHGWALYLQKGEVCFATTHGGRRTVLRSGTNIEGETLLRARLDHQGRVHLWVNGKLVKVGQVPGPLSEQPLDGLQVGQDPNGCVGEYSAPFAFEGRIESATVEIPGKAQP